MTFFLYKEIWPSPWYYMYLVHTSEKGDVSGLLNCLADALHAQCMDVEDNKDSVLGFEGKPVLVGGGTDGVFENIAVVKGMRGSYRVLFLGYFGHGVVLNVLSWLAKVCFPVPRVLPFWKCYSGSHS